MFQIEIENPGLIRSLGGLGDVTKQKTRRWLSDMAEWVREDLKARVPVKTGRLKASIGFEIAETVGGGEATFYADAKDQNGNYYGRFVDEGTGKYGPSGQVIRAQNGKPFHFQQHGQEWFHWSLDGMKPRNFTQKTFRASIEEADRQAELVAESIFRTVVE